MKAYSVDFKAKISNGTRYRTWCFAIEFAKDENDALEQAKKELIKHGYDPNSIKDIEIEINEEFYLPF